MAQRIAGEDKHVLVIDASGAALVKLDDSSTSSIGDFNNKQYMGKQTVSTIDYFGYKLFGSGSWFIMRMDKVNKADVTYQYGTTNFSGAWVDPTVGSYYYPPDTV